MPASKAPAMLLIKRPGVFMRYSLCFCVMTVALAWLPSLSLLAVYGAVPAGLATDENGTSDQPLLSVNSRAAKHQMTAFLPAR